MPENAYAMRGTSSSHSRHPVCTGSCVEENDMVCAYVSLILCTVAVLQQ